MKASKDNIPKGVGKKYVSYRSADLQTAHDRLTAPRGKVEKGTLYKKTTSVFRTFEMNTPR